MPTYDYECKHCKKHFEIFHSMRQSKRKCPECGHLSLIKKISGGAGLIFRGQSGNSGFYELDYKRNVKDEGSTDSGRDTLPGHCDPKTP